MQIFLDYPLVSFEDNKRIQILPLILLYCYHKTRIISILSSQIVSQGQYQSENYDSWTNNDPGLDLAAINVRLGNLVSFYQIHAEIDNDQILLYLNEYKFKSQQDTAD